MRYPRLLVFSSSAFAVSLAVSLGLTGCTSSIGSMTGSSSGKGAAPTVTAVVLQQDVEPNSKQEVQFSEAMDPGTINAQTFTVADSSGHAVAGVVSYDESYHIASFQPSPALQPVSKYTATIATGVASAGGAPLAAPYTYTFTTTYNTTGDYNQPFSISSVSPTSGATCVSTTTPITITFNRPPDASTVNSTDIVITGPNGAVIPVTMTINASTTQVLLMPNAPLPSGTINGTVQKVADLAGVAMTSPYTWSFSTACSGGGGGTGGGTSMQYMAPLSGITGYPGGGQVSVDTAGTVTLQLQGAVANKTLTLNFCTNAISGETTSDCMPVGTVTTDGSGNASMSAKFPQSGAWVGDFQLSNGPENPNEEGFDNVYDTGLGPGYMSTLLGGKVNSGAAASTNGTVSYSSSPAPNGSIVFSLTGAAANTAYDSIEEGLYDSSSDYELYDSSNQSTFTTNSAGAVTFTVLPDGQGGDFFYVEPDNGSGQGYVGGFVVP